MKLLTSILAALLLSSTFIACSKPGVAVPGTSGPPPTTEPLSPGIVGEYQYIGFDEKGVKISEGRLTIASVDERRIGSETQLQIKGSWDLKEVAHRDQIGLQIGTGDLTGAILNGEVILDLNPNISDANVILKGKVTGNRFTGTWSFNAYDGPRTKGTFSAVRK